MILIRCRSDLLLSIRIPFDCDNQIVCLRWNNISLVRFLSLDQYHGLVISDSVNMMCLTFLMIISICIRPLLELLHGHTLPFYVLNIFCLVSSLLTLIFDCSMMQHHCWSLYRLIEWESKYLFSILPSMLLMCNLCLGILHIVLDLSFLVSVRVVLLLSILFQWENCNLPYIYGSLAIDVSSHYLVLCRS